MLVAARSPVRAGLVAWPDGTRIFTVVVKQTFDVVSHGVATLSAEQPALCLDVLGSDDLVLYPTDFAPAKSVCDVVLVGDILGDPRGPARLAVDPIRKLVELPRALGPRRGFGAGGDPTDPKVHRAWGAATLDFDPFQSAPRDQRRPCTPLPIDVVYDLGRSRVATTLGGRAPEVLLIDEGGWTAPTMIAVRADSLLIDPDNAQITLVFRGVFEVPEGCEPLLVVESEAPMRSFAPRDMEHWPRAEAIEPGFLRRVQALTSAARIPGNRLDDEQSWETTARLDGSLSYDGTTPAAAPLLRDAIASLEAEPPPTSSRGGGGGPTIAAPVKAPSFGTPPRVAPAPVAPLPVAPLPKARLGGMMMLPLETRHPPDRTSSSPPANSAADAHDDHQSEDVLARTTLAKIPEELREPSSPPILPFAGASSPTPSGAPPFIAPSADATPFGPRGIPDVVGPGAAHRSAARTIPLPERDGSSPSRAKTEPPPATLHAAPPVRYEPPSAPPFFAPPPVRIAPLTPSDLEDAGEPRATSPEPPGAAPAPAKLDRPRDDDADPETGLQHADFIAIKAELWASPDDRARTLAARGLTDLAWRSVERRFAAKLARRVDIQAEPSSATAGVDPP